MCASLLGIIMSGIWDSDLTEADPPVDWHSYTRCWYGLTLRLCNALETTGYVVLEAGRRYQRQGGRAGGGRGWRGGGGEEEDTQDNSGITIMYV